MHSDRLLNSIISECVSYNVMGKQYILTLVTLFLECDTVSLAEISEHFGRNTFSILRDLTLMMEIESCCEMCTNSYQKKRHHIPAHVHLQEWKKWHDLCVAV
jgi:hypothetical protein